MLWVVTEMGGWLLWGCGWCPAVVLGLGMLLGGWEGVPLVAPRVVSFLVSLLGVGMQPGVWGWVQQWV